VYTGSYTSTPLASYCSTELVYTTLYPKGKVTSTVTRTDTPVVTSTSYIPATSTHYYYDATTTVTVPHLYYTYTDATSTTTVGTECATTSYTATASATTTQAAKCAPTNLITGLSSSGNQDGLDNVRYSGNETANKDASSCCQACVDSDCVAMDFTPGFGCTLWKNSGDDCGRSIQVTYGFTYGPGFSAQAGCGSVFLA
jgi:hypothetical protein